LSLLGRIADRIERDVTRTWANPSWWNLFVVLPWVIGATLLIHEWKVERNIAAREQTTYGVITSHEPKNHNRYGYAFSVDEKTFNGWESPKKDELEIGKQVLIYYDPRDPARNALTDFGDLSISSLGPVPAMLFGVGALAWYISTQRRRTNKDRS
jgi:Protein of unknown function (DUF3592)